MREVIRKVEGMVKAARSSRESHSEKLYRQGYNDAIRNVVVMLRNWRPEVVEECRAGAETAIRTGPESVQTVTDTESTEGRP